MKMGRTFLRHTSRMVAIVPSAAFLLGSYPASAAPILGSELASFAVLGASTVTNTGPTTLVGNLGVSPGTAITALASITITGTVHQTDPFASLAQSQLVTARNNLGTLGAGSLLPADMAGLSLLPGVYTVPAGVSNLTGTLTLNGAGNANAAWIFQMPSTLITSPGAVVDVVNTGAGAGVYWNVGSSATLDTATSFQGNILALASITLNHATTIGCGRALAQTGAVTMDNNTVNAIGCAETGEEGSGGLSGGLDVTTSPDGSPEVSFLPFAAVTSIPESGTLFIFGLGLVGLIGFRRISPPSQEGLRASR